MKATTRTILLILLACSGCDDGDDLLKSKTFLLVDKQWINPELVGQATSGYALVSPLSFSRDGKATIGGSQVTWRFTDDGAVIETVHMNPLTQDESINKYEIMNLTETELHVKHYDQRDNFLAEMKYRTK